ncbi:MAG TPA: hypothetical protein PLV92_20945, partial [Pirellulaceae bacterium]|nr:hypothetical protein [Pirellulaceae bacterium]
IAVSGAGADARNYLYGGVSAYVGHSVIDSAHDIDIVANDESKIQATIVGVSAAIGGGGTAGVGASVGFSLARNYVGWRDTAGSLTTTYSTSQTPSALNKGQTVRISSGPREGDVYEYLGPSIADGDPNKSGVQVIDLASQNFQDADLWKPLGLVAAPGGVMAYSEDASLRATGSLTIDASATQTIDATVIAASVALAAGGAAGVGVSGAGVYAQNKINFDVQAFVLGDGAQGVHAGDVTITADDGASISAVAGAASVAGSAGGAAGVSVSIGLAVARNEIRGDVAAFIRNADQGVVTTTGDVDISATMLGRPVFDATFASLGFTAADLDDASKADQDDPSTTTTNESTQDATGDMTIAGKLRTAFSSRGESLASIDSVGTSANYSTRDGKRNLREGVTVRLASSYSLGGVGGRIYRYIGADRDQVDLAKENYGDSSKWLLVDKLKVAEVVKGSSWTLLAPDGATYILTKSGNSLFVSRSMMNVVTAAASVAAGAGLAAGVAVSGAGAVSDNIVLTHTNAFIDNSQVTSARDLTLDAVSKSTMNATVVAASIALGGGTAGVG